MRDRTGLTSGNGHWIAARETGTGNDAGIIRAAEPQTSLQ
jgi:hypothetical protein